MREFQPVKLTILAIKLAISGLLAWLLFTHVNFAPIGHFLESSRALVALALCVTMFLGQALLAAVRIRWIMRLMGTQLPLRVAYGNWMIGLLIGQTMVTFIAGDAVRIWRLIQLGYGKRLSGGAVFLERAIGFSVLMAMTMACIPFLLSQGPSPAVRTGLISLAALCAAGILGFVVSGFVHKIMVRIVPGLDESRIGTAVVDVLSAARHLGSSYGLSTCIIAISAAMHLCNAITFYILGSAAHLGLAFAPTVIVAVPVMLIGLLPIALAGWGVRESAAIIGYGVLGISPEVAMTISVAFGLSLLIASLPGGLFLWSGKRRDHHELAGKAGLFFKSNT